ncbi:MAG: GatB/YqeY domain-containing protein [Candidatus Neomarinimicrobiota bacterium]|nr:GatB/YqeY domain-containing protein [Candidatus Neomarinimicrobiota bacterium]RKY48872.1 MAG: GatB/YqeY domain-containing protein [Candidatus Neomarinimicrobiota bacterium]RKY54394.1 MAG: GatB/YqeY domain-containing protein [Candidatus Neomarinimicrobiota bacterium]
MTLKERLQKELVEAMRARDTLKVDVIRLLRNSIRQKEIELKKELSDDDVIKILSNAAKQRRESIKAYEAGKREDLVEREKRELDIIESYLPEKLPQEELIKIVEDVIKEVGASSLRDLGKVMPKVMAKVKGRADGSEVQAIVRSKLVG